jgi:hypothetical protein
MRSAVAPVVEAAEGAADGADGAVRSGGTVRSDTAVSADVGAAGAGVPVARAVVPGAGSAGAPDAVPREAGPSGRARVRFPVEVASVEVASGVGTELPATGPGRAARPGAVVAPVAVGTGAPAVAATSPTSVTAEASATHRRRQ